MKQPSAFSLLELNQYIRRVISMNFEQPIWVECEIGQASTSRGHWYLDLIQKEEQTIVAQSQAALWANVYFYLKRKSPVPPEDILRQGMSVRLKINVDFHERYGLKLIIEDIDSSFTIGNLEIQRQAILKAIRERDLIRRNAIMTRLSPAVQRLAVISAPKAAGYADFVRHIDDNPYGYDIRIELFESAMQGMLVEPEMLTCLDAIARRRDEFDAVAIIRGGGGRTDLAAFDNLALAVRIAEYPLPVLIGIGHEIDQSVLDLVAHTSLKTPTAVADFIISHNATFETWLDETARNLQDEVLNRLAYEDNRLSTLAREVSRSVQGRLAFENRRLTTLTHDVSRAAQYRLANEDRKLNALAHDVSRTVHSRLAREQQRLSQVRGMLKYVAKHAADKQHRHLDHLAGLLKAMDPDDILARGFTITSHQGKTMTSATQVAPGMVIDTAFHDGTVKSKIE
jgi:exodeoxyribonuclease VII large subunit